MTHRVFSPKCIVCRQRTMALVPVPFKTKISHDGRQYDVEIPELVLPKCSNCGNTSLDDEANRAIDLAFRRQTSLLTPEEIRAGREHLGLNQQQFADLLGISVSTLSRWETGMQIQQRVLNNYMKAVFDLPVLRGYLRTIGLGHEDPVINLSPCHVVRMGSVGLSLSTSATQPVDSRKFKRLFTRSLLRYYSRSTSHVLSKDLIRCVDASKCHVALSWIEVARKDTAISQLSGIPAFVEEHSLPGAACYFYSPCARVPKTQQPAMADRGFGLQHKKTYPRSKPGGNYLRRRLKNAAIRALESPLSLLTREQTSGSVYTS